MKQKTEFEIIAEKNINALKSKVEFLSDVNANQQKEIVNLKNGMVQMNNNFDQFKNQVQIMVAGQYGSGPTKR